MICIKYMRVLALVLKRWIRVLCFVCLPFSSGYADKSGLEVGLGFLGHTDMRLHNAVDVSWSRLGDFRGGLTFARETFGRASQSTLLVYFSEALSVDQFTDFLFHSGLGFLRYDTVVPDLEDGLHREIEYNFGWVVGCQYRIPLSKVLQVQFNSRSLIAPAGAGGLFLVTGRVHYLGAGVTYVL
ncbi:MAG: hypothetical protein OXT67_03860 [Zetaproteobacteria bacterium]|nr:hypothetical protein [Zetaproteobacteria bacterium]